jgi:hypothetical protein
VRVEERSMDHHYAEVRPCVHLACLEKIYGVQAVTRSLNRSIAVVGLVRTDPCVRAPGIIAGIETLPIFCFD